MRPLDPRVLPHLRPARWALAGVVAGSVASGLLVVVQALALATLVTDVLDHRWRTATAVVLAGALVARAVLGVVVDGCAAHAAGVVGAGLRQQVLRRALAMPATELDRHRRGALALLATRGVTAVEPYLTRYLPALVVSAVLPGVTLVAIWWQDWIAGLVVTCTLPLLPVFAALIGLQTRDRAERQWRALSHLSGHFVDVVRGLATLVAFRRAEAQSPRIRAITDRYRRANRDVLRLAFASSAVLELVATLSVAMVAVTVGLRLAGGTLDFRTALAVLLLAPEAYWPIRRVGAEFHAAAEGAATFEAIDALGSPPDAADLALPGTGHLELDRLTITWPGRTRPAVTSLSATFPATGLCVISGPSGSGKSTVLAALLGDLAPASGAMSFAGLPLDGLDRAGFMAHLPQRPWLLDGTVRQNLLLGRTDATDVELSRALARVGLALPLDRELGEDGAALSAGQRARVALARVLLTHRPLVLLDEPTAHLDAASRAIVMDVLADLAQERCVVAVTHDAELRALADVEVALVAPGVDPVPMVPVDRGLDAPAPVDTAGPSPVSSSRWRLALGVLLGTGATASGLALTATAGWLLAKAAEHPAVLTLLVAIIGVRTFGLARPALRYAERLVSHDVALRLLAERRAQVYDALVPLVPGALDRRRGDLLATLVEDVDALLDEQLRVRMPVWTWLGTSAVATAVAWAFLPAAGELLAVFSLGVGALAWKVARRSSAAAARRRILSRGEISRLCLAVIEDARGLVHWRADARALERVSRQDRRLARAGLLVSLGTGAARVLPLLGAAVSVPLMAWLVRDGAVSAPIGAMLVLLPLAMVDALTPVGDAGGLSVEVAAARRRVDSLLEIAPVVTDPVDAMLSLGTTPLVVEGASAGHGTRVAFEGLDLELRAGERVGVVGPSGSGKSTLAAMLMRFVPVSSGRYDVAGVGVDRLRLDDVRAGVGVLDDDPHLFSSSVAENVRLARPGASDAEVVAALESAHLGAWLAGLPHGAGTLIGDGAASVSGGERARIGLARLILADQPVMVLDEPTAHLDADTARAVADQVLDRDRAIVWITHSSLGLDRMDRVLDLGARASDLVGVSPA